MHYLSSLFLILSDSSYEEGITGTSEIKCKSVNCPLRAEPATTSSSSFLASCPLAPKEIQGNSSINLLLQDKLTPLFLPQCW